MDAQRVIHTSPPFVGALRAMTQDLKNQNSAPRAADIDRVAQLC